jgi:signal transduction histidine kinase
MVTDMLSLFRDLSFRYKIPLRATVLAVATALAVTGSLIFREYDELRRDLLLNSESMGRVLARTLIAPMVHDDVWRAFEIINSPFHSGPQEGMAQTAEVVMVLDAKGQIYVSTQPSQYPMLTEPARINPEYARLQQAILDYRGTEPTAIEIPGSNNIYVITPIVSDGILLGTLVMRHSKTVFLPRFFGIAKRGGLITLLVLAVLLPISWYWGRRMAIPLIQLANCMGKIGPRIPSDLECKLYESKDEIGQVGVAFKRMFNELREKESLENQMMASERLAAIGRLSAGIAHEINNPLGGMLNAISTYKRHGPEDPLTLKTLDLLERGLQQIKDTVAALLVEARVESHPLTRQDIEDTHTLVLPDARKKSARFVWENDILGTLPLPSTLVRQILINLLLNAMKAVEPGGHVYCHIYRTSGSLFILVKNDGKHIPPEDVPYLFEPFSRLSENGHGLGLWVTYQIVRQLQGDIGVKSRPGETRFLVELPFEKPPSYLPAPGG